MATQAKIISSLASLVDKPFDVNLQEQLKHIIDYKRANYTQQFLEKHPDQRGLFLQKFTVELEKAPTDDCMPVEGCVILRTTCEMPKPIRNSSVVFDFVGDSNFMTGYGKEDPSYVQDTAYNRFTKKKPKWFYMNNRIYIYNTTVIKRIGVRGIFEDPKTIAACACEGPACYSEDSEYPIALDLLNAIVRDTLQVELRKYLPTLTGGEVELDKLEEQMKRGLAPNDRA